MLADATSTGASQARKFAETISGIVEASAGAPVLNSDYRLAIDGGGSTLGGAEFALEERVHAFQDLLRFRGVINFGPQA